MLRIHQSTNSAEAKRYYCAAYYTKGHELERVGDWGGHGAAMLGLAGEVVKEEFERLCDNLNPSTGKPLTARNRDDRTIGFDHNFNVPKSVSLLYARYQDEAILDAVRTSVRETMADIEREMKTRVRKGGQDGDRTTGNMVFAEFLHFTSRPKDEKSVPDPSLHYHVFAFNSTFDPVERQWKAGQFRDIKRDAPYWEAEFHSRLAGRMKALGYQIERNGRDWDIGGLSRDLLRKFSKRTSVIEEKATALGLSSPEAIAELGGTTRSRKRKDLTWEELRDDWESQLTKADREQLDFVQTEGRFKTEGEGTTPAVAMDHAIKKSFERASTISAKRLMAEALRRGLGDVSVEAARKELDGHGILLRDRDGQTLATTKEVLGEEQAMLAFAREGRGQCSPLLTHHQIERVWLSPNQQRAVRGVLESTDRVVVIRGLAGSGKTTQMQETVNAIDASGVSVVVVAPSAESSRGTLREEAGFEKADTLQRFLVDREFQKQLAGGVLWIDEAGLVGTQDLASAFRIAAEQNARVVLQGDSKQHKSVPRGTALRLLETQAGIVPIELAEIRRQHRADYRAAVEALAAGDAQLGFDRLDALGWVREFKDGAQHKQLAFDYAEALQKGETVLAISPTHREGQRLDAAIREELKRRDIIGVDEHEFLRLVPLNLTEAERADAATYRGVDMPLVVQFVQNAKGFTRGERFEVRGVKRDQVYVRSKTGTDLTLPLTQANRFQVYVLAAIKLAAGDKVRITQNGQTADRKHKLNNGAVYDVAGFTPNGDIRLGNGWILARDGGHLASGRVLTSHSSQSRTVDRVFIADSTESAAATNRAMLYVSASRGRKSAALYTDQKDELRKAVNRADERISATELIGAQPAPCKTLAKRRSVRLASHVASLQRAATQAQAYASRVIDNVRDRVSELLRNREMAHE